MREIRKRLERLEGNRKLQRQRSPSPALPTIEQTALQRLSDADQDLFRRGKSEGLEGAQTYSDMMVRFEAAFAAASSEFNVPYFDASDRGWL
jgi:hypothetical protein